MPCLRLARILALCLLFSTLVQPFPALAAFDSPAHWEVSRETDFQAENRYRYDAPSRLLNSWLTTEQVEEILSDSRGRIDDPFRVPRRLEPQVRFWLKIYTVYSSQEAVLFDEEHPELVYETLDFRELARKSRNRIAFEIVSRRALQRRVDQYRAGFEELARARKGSRLSPLARRIAELRESLSHVHAPREAKASLRVQWGQRDQVMSGLLSSNSFLRRMEGIFTQMDVPPELVLLSLVESSFNWNAISHAGATGIWQFMPNTGREFMLVDPVQQIDERLSPIKSTVAAARLLLRNHRMLGSWPKAVSAYNHGHSKWARAGSAVIDPAPVLAQCSRSRPAFKLGFASRNYYPEFLALLHAYKYQDIAYGRAPEGRTDSVRFVQTRASLPVGALASQNGLTESELRRLNPDIKSAGAKIPEGYWLSLPAVADDFSTLIRSRPRSLGMRKSSAQKGRLADAPHRITRRG